MSITPGSLRRLAFELDSVANAVDFAIESARASFDLEMELARLGATESVEDYRTQLFEALTNASRCLMAMADGALYARKKGTCEGMIEHMRAREARAQFRVVPKEES